VKRYPSVVASTLAAEPHCRGTFVVYPLVSREFQDCLVSEVCKVVSFLLSEGGLYLVADVA
jgi:hypothetical protein